jgi:c-di-GMP phosphodiesterase
MPPSPPPPPSVQSCFFARHPIFDRNMKLWGYQLLYRDCEQAESARFKDQDQATVQVILEAAASPSLGLALPFTLNYSADTSP